MNRKPILKSVPKRPVSLPPEYKGNCNKAKTAKSCLDQQTSNTSWSTSLMRSLMEPPNQIELLFVRHRRRDSAVTRIRTRPSAQHRGGRDRREVCDAFL